jgi:hypothetical protein
MRILAALAALFSLRLPGIEIVNPEPVADNVVVLKPVLEPRIQAIRKIASLRLAKQHVPLDLLAHLSDARIEWIKALDVQMLLLLSQSSQHRIREHIAGRRAIRGVLAADMESVKAYKEAVKPKVPVIDHEGRRGGGGGPKIGQ